MLTRPLHHIRQNLVAYLALFVALGGTSYAALSLPAGSVGARQLRNHSITAVKLDPRSIAGSVRAWVNVQWQGGRLVAQASSSPVRITTITDGDGITWPRQRFGRNCMASVTPQVGGAGGPSGTVTVQFLPTDGLLYLFGFGPAGTPRPQAAYVMIVCP